MRYLAAALIVAGLLLPGAAPAAEKYSTDESHTTIGFAVKHFGISTVRGKFRKFDVDLQVDETDLTKSALNVTIQTASVFTDNEKRDTHLKSDDFFNAEKYPAITFKSKQIAKKGDGYVVTGDLTIRDVTKEVTLPIQLIGPFDDPFGNKRIGMAGETKIDRQNFNLKWNMPLETGGVIVSNDVQIEVTGEFTRKKES